VVHISYDTESVEREDQLGEKLCGNNVACVHCLLKTTSDDDMLTKMRCVVCVVLCVVLCRHAKISWSCATENTTMVW
jgi:hypothetical protein